MTSPDTPGVTWTRSRFKCFFRNGNNLVYDYGYVNDKDTLLHQWDQWRREYVADKDHFFGAQCSNWRRA